MPQNDDPNRTPAPEAPTGNTRPWIWLSILAALLAIVGSVISLSASRVYAGLTAAFLPQALAQDIANLALASPAMLILGAMALRGSLRAYLLWLGVVTFTVYNYVIYTFSVPFGPLFLLWVAVLGLSIYALIGGVATPDHTAVKARFTSHRPVQGVALSLIVVSVFFSLLWLSEDVPALLAGVTPQSIVDMALPNNPVHILDLAFFLPAAMAAGFLLLKRKPLGYTIAPSLIVFLVLTGVPILLTPIVQTVRGQAAAWGVAPPIGTLTAALIGLLVWLLSAIRTGH